MSLELVVKLAKSFDMGHVREFAKLVVSGGQVTAIGLAKRIASAHHLTFLTIVGELVGTNAVKNNRTHQR